MRGTWQGSGTWKTTGGGGGLVLIVALVLIGSGAASAIASAVVTLLIVIGAVIGAALLGGIGWLIYRASQPRPQLSVAYRLPPVPAQRLEDPQRPCRCSRPPDSHPHSRPGR